MDKLCYSLVAAGNNDICEEQKLHHSRNAFCGSGVVCQLVLEPYRTLEKYGLDVLLDSGVAILHHETSKLNDLIRVSWPSEAEYSVFEVVDICLRRKRTTRAGKVVHGEAPDMLQKCGFFLP